MQKLSDNPKVAARQMVERKIAKLTIEVLLKAGFSLGVNDGEEQVLSFSKDAREVFEAMFTTDEDLLLIFEPARDPNDADKRPDMWVRFVYGNDGWDVIADYSHSVSLNPYLGDGSEVQSLIDRMSARSI